MYAGVLVGAPALFRRNAKKTFVSILCTACIRGIRREYKKEFLHSLLICGCSIMGVCDLPKVEARVRFPSSAQVFKTADALTHPGNRSKVDIGVIQLY